MNSRDFRPSERRSKLTANPLEALEFLLIDQLEAATGPLTGTTEAEVLVIRWKWDVSDLGDWDADTNTPMLSSGTGSDGAKYTVSVAGSTSLDGESSWSIGDVVEFYDGAWNKLDDERKREYYATELTETLVNSSVNYSGEPGTYGQAKFVNGSWKPDNLDCEASEEGIAAVLPYTSGGIGSASPFGAGGFGEGGFGS